MNVVMEGADQIAIQLDHVSEDILRKVRKQIELGGQRIVRQAQKNITKIGAVDTGNTRASIHSELSDDGMTVTVGPSEKTGEWVELGTPPHPVSPEGMRQILEWVHRKLGLEGMEAMNAAAAIAWKIRARGQKPRPYLLPAFESEKAKIIDSIEKALQEGL